MSSETVDEGSQDSIGPQLTLEDVTLPPTLAERVGQFYGTGEPVQTGAAWIDAMAEAFTEEHDRQPTVEDLCTTADGAHEFESAGSDDVQSYVCVLDPLAYPFLTGTTGTVRSETPVRGTEVAFEVGEDGIDCSHEDAVISLGVAEEVDAGADPSLEAVYRQFCGYIHAFADADEYETWTDDVEAVTTSLPAREGVAVARGIAARLFDASERPGTA